MTAVRLRPHQELAVDTTAPVLAEHGRATVVMACGTGKTLVGAETAARLSPDEPVFVAVPTIDLLGQTAAAWASYDPRRRIAAVCSDAGVLEHYGLPGRTVTTSSSEIADVEGPAVVFGTYASLEVVAEAHRLRGRAPWGTVVVDEAHRTAGAAGKAWGIIHDDGLIPARHRLNLTATPRYFDTEAAVAVSMDDAAVFGPVAHRLGFAQAIADRLLSDYRVVVPLVTDASMVPLMEQASRYLAAGEVVDTQSLAMAVAMIRAADEHRMRKAISYHSRITEAAEFARALRLASHLLGEPGAPRDVGADFVHGDQPLRTRAYYLDALRGSRRALEVLANVRILAEGVDVPAVDGVLFAYAKTSMPDIIQAVGRALRLHEDSAVATIVIPVFVPEGVTAEQAVSDSGYAGLWNVLQALQAFDDRLDDPQVLRAALGGRRGDGELVERGGAPRVFVEAEKVPEGFVQAIEVKTLNIAARRDWLAGCLQARRWFEEHGHLDVPYDQVTGDGFQLGRWITSQRNRAQTGSMSAEQRRYLDTLGMVWDAHEQKWWRTFALVAAYHAEHGNLRAPERYKTSGGVALGAWLKVQRAKQRSGKLTERQQAALEGLGMVWETRTVAAWEQGLAYARAYHAQHGHLRMANAYRAGDGFSLGRWLHEQRGRYRAGAMDGANAAALEELGIEWGATLQDRFENGLRAAQAYHAEHGSLQMPRDHVTPDGFHLATWLQTQLKRRAAGTLETDRIAALDALGIVWRTSTRPGA